MTGLRASVIGIVVSCAVVGLFATLSSFALSNARLAEAVATALANSELAYSARIREDFFTECALLEMQQLRQGGAFWNALDTRFIMRPQEHPCETLRVLVLGTAEERASLPTPVSYFNYPFGSRHLEAVVLSALDYGPATVLYRALSYGSVVLLFAAMLWRSPATAMLLVPIPLFLTAAFAFQRFGGNLAHAPGFFIGFTALAVFVAAPGFFANSGRRLGFAGALGVIAAYFDLINGVIVTLLALTILLDYFFYVAAERDRSGDLRNAAAQAVAIFACFLVAYVVVTVGRLGVLWVGDVDVSRFMDNLAVRTAQDIGVPLTFWQNLETLFALRSQLTPGGTVVANWIFLAGIAGWIFAGLTGLVFAFRRRLAPGLVDALVLAAVSAGILVWYWCFTAHTFIHAAFVVRLLAIPLACGIVAAILAAQTGLRDSLPAVVLPVMLCASLGLAALLLHGRWAVATATAGHIVQASADLVGCAPLGLRPDEKPDGVIEIAFENPTPPLAYLGLAARRDTVIQLVRRDHTRAYHTGAFFDVLGIALRPGGPLLNRPDGGFRFFQPTSRVFAHFCRDGDRPNAEYTLIVDGVTVPITQ